MDALYQDALAHLERGELEEAEKLLQEYLRHCPNHAMAWHKLGLVYAKRRQLSKAKEYFLQAIKEDPHLAPALNNLGNIARVEGNLDEAIDYYQRAIAIEPEAITPHRNLAIVYKQKLRFGDYFREWKTIRRLKKENKNV